MKLLLLFILLLFYTIACSKIDKYTNQKNYLDLEIEFEILVNQAIKESAPIVFRLDTITNFKWDTLLIITPYTPIEQVQNKIGIDLGELTSTNIVSDEISNVLAFIHNGELVKYCDLPRDKGDFESYDSTICLSPEESKFELIKTKQYFSSGRIVVKAVPVSDNNKFIRWD